jgi:ribosome-binding protein aMBF1 (putative translation factor)
MEKTSLVTAECSASSDLQGTPHSGGGHGRHRARLSEAMMKTKVVLPAKARVVVSVGESVRIVRELQGLTQSKLARRTKIPQSTISAIENDTINLGVERAKTLARVLRCHPAVLVFPGWNITKQSAA